MDRLAGEKSADVGRGALDHPPRAAVTAAREVERHQNPRQVRKRVAPGCLVGDDVQAGSGQMPGLDRVVEGRLVDEAAARC